MAGLIRLAIFVTVILLVAWAAHGQTISPNEALQRAQAEALLPVWADAGDMYRLKFVGGGAYLCLQDATSGARWTVTGPVQLALLAIRTATWPWGGPHTGVTYAERRICWPDMPSRPLATGEPAYWSIICMTACDGTLPLDWAAMNLPRNLAGTTVIGEECGEPQAYGFWTLPRIRSAGGLIAVTRCTPP